MRVMDDITDPRLMYLKAVLFLVAGCLGAVGILIETPALRTALLLGITVWSFCRLYYFLFYVIEHYIDPGYRFAGLASAARYLWRNRPANRGPE
jgi:uncharacterized RDD family membrane protein YckC